MKTIETRIEFTRCVGLLLSFMAEHRYEGILNECLRHPMVAEWNSLHCRVMSRGKRCEQIEGAAVHGHAGHGFKPIGIKNSCHTVGLAVDIYLIKDGEIWNQRDGYSVLGDYWKSLHPLARWGGDFTGFPDLGHFSFEHDGRK